MRAQSPDIANDYNNERPPGICVTNSSASLTHVSENRWCQQPLQDFTCSMMTWALMPSDVSQVAQVLGAVTQNQNPWIGSWKQKDRILNDTQESWRQRISVIDIADDDTYKEENKVHDQHRNLWTTMWPQTRWKHPTNRCRETRRSHTIQSCQHALPHHTAIGTIA